MNSIIKIILSFLIASLFIANIAAQDNSNCAPGTTLSVYIAKQSLVCPPDGYNRDGSHSCPEIDKDKIGDWLAGEQIYPIKSNVSIFPPDRIRLNETQVSIANDYIKRCKLNGMGCGLEGREAILLVFNFGIENPDGAKVEFKRINKSFRDYEIKGTLQSGGTWINHQNANAFIPEQDTKWQLVVINKTEKQKWSCFLRVSSR